MFYMGNSSFQRTALLFSITDEEENKMLSYKQLPIEFFDFLIKNAIVFPVPLGLIVYRSEQSLREVRLGEK